MSSGAAERIAVGVLDDFQNVTRTIARWHTLAPRASVTVFTDHIEGDALTERLQPFDALVLTRERTRLTRALLARLPRLRLVVTTGWRNLGIDMEACRERGIPVCGTDSGSTPTAELAWGLILAAARNIAAEDAALRQGRWQTTLGFSLRGKTLGIVGLGRLGSQVARIGRAFGMHTVAWSQNLSAARAQEEECVRVEKAELFRTADVVSIHLLLSARTQGIVGRNELMRMKRSAILINTARAAIVDEAALVEALTAKRIAGAGLDVFGEEPLPPDAPILKAPNTVLTPHLGYVTHETYGIYFPQARENIEAWLDGTPIRIITG